jgi:hypothetical protein
LHTVRGITRHPRCGARPRHALRKAVDQKSLRSVMPKRRRSL